MLPELDKLLDYLEEKLDPSRQAESEELHRAALSWEKVPRLPLVMRYPFPEDAPFHPFPHGQIFNDVEKMLFNELVYAFGSSIALSHATGDDLPWTVRPNFGTVLVASCFGARVEQVEDHWPWVRPFGAFDEFRRALASPRPGAEADTTRRVMECFASYRALIAGHPKLEKAVKIVLPDLQGPLDTADLLRGSGVYTDFYERPEALAESLALIAGTQTRLAKSFLPMITDGPAGFSHQHAAMIRGSILIRDDSAVMISPDMYRERVAPYDAKVLEALGGGGIHSCGKIEHNAANILSIPGIRTFDMGQPEMNDIDKVYFLARERKIALTRVSVSEEELVTARVLRRFPTGVSLSHMAPSLQKAREIFSAYLRAAEAFR